MRYPRSVPTALRAWTRPWRRRPQCNKKTLPGVPRKPVLTKHFLRRLVVYKIQWLPWPTLALIKGKMPHVALVRWIPGSTMPASGGVLAARSGLRTPPQHALRSSWYLRTLRFPSPRRSWRRECRLWRRRAWFPACRPLVMLGPTPYSRCYNCGWQNAVLAGNIVDRRAPQESRLRGNMLLKREVSGRPTWLQSIRTRNCWVERVIPHLPHYEFIEQPYGAFRLGHKVHEYTVFATAAVLDLVNQISLNLTFPKLLTDSADLEIAKEHSETKHCELENPTSSSKDARHREAYHLPDIIPVQGSTLHTPQLLESPSSLLPPRLCIARAQREVRCVQKICWLRKKAYHLEEHLNKLAWCTYCSSWTDHAFCGAQMCSRRTAQSWGGSTCVSCLTKTEWPPPVFRRWQNTCLPRRMWNVLCLLDTRRQHLQKTVLKHRRQMRSAPTCNGPPFGTTIPILLGFNVTGLPVAGELLLVTFW